MKALITGASSGIGRDIAIELCKAGYDLIVVARREDKLSELQKSLKTNVEAICLDLSRRENCFELYERTKDSGVEILINNAGFGQLGRFDETDLTTELRMIDTNITAVHILTKLFIKDFKRRNGGYILNVASAAGFLPGPLMATYYSTKAYVLRLTQGIYEELKRDKSRVYIGALCPGPVNTEFGSVAGVTFSSPHLESADVAKYAVKKCSRARL
ncbi:MAG: putative oxidoreductase [Firmicutes bacterium ADurb.Bin193]|nr:MAG: putative oxidoreductase [Firmicutes bacterium ADurb.Bin193]